MKRVDLKVEITFFVDDDVKITGGEYVEINSCCLLSGAGEQIAECLSNY